MARGPGASAPLIDAAKVARVVRFFFLDQQAAIAEGAQALSHGFAICGIGQNGGYVDASIGILIGDFARAETGWEAVVIGVLRAILGPEHGAVNGGIKSGADFGVCGPRPAKGPGDGMPLRAEGLVKGVGAPIHAEVVAIRSIVILTANRPDFFVPEREHQFDLGNGLALGQGGGDFGRGVRKAHQHATIQGVKAHRAGAIGPDGLATAILDDGIKNFGRSVFLQDEGSVPLGGNSPCRPLRGDRSSASVGLPAECSANRGKRGRSQGCHGVEGVSFF